MQLQTKFLRLRTPVTLGSRFGDWQVYWLGGWNKHRFGFMVMVVRVSPPSPAFTSTQTPSEVASVGRRVVGTERERDRSTKNLLISPIGVIHGDGANNGAERKNDSDMKVFMITAKNEVRTLTSGQKARAGGTVFSSAEELAASVRQWPMARLVEVWNLLPGAKPLSKFTDRKTAVRRLWEVLQAVAAIASQQPRKVGSEGRAGPAPARQASQGHTARKGSKTEIVLALLRQPSGATLGALMRATQWQAHSVRGFISGQLGRRMGLHVKSFRRDGDRVYCLRG